MALPGTESVRFRRPTAGPNAVGPAQPPKKDEFGSLAPAGWKRRHQGLLQDKVRRSQAGPMVPSFTVALRLLLLIRTAGAMYSIISDCDEVFNFYEPLHYFQHNTGFQTWELSPQFAVRSWAYILVHWPLAALLPKILRLGKRQEFFVLRILLGFISSVCEAKFFRAVVDNVNERVGRYTFFAMALSAGMWNASVAFLPSSFAMYTTAIASSYALYPATSTPTGVSRAYKATFFFALGAILGWPFSAALGIPFVVEQLFLTGGNIAVGKDREALFRFRLETLAKAVAVGASIAIPVFLIDSWAYGRRTLTPLNIVWYNLFSGAGPKLYGTSPATYYVANLFLNFNYLVPFALVSGPALVVTYYIDNRRLGKTQQAPKAGETSAYTLLAVRLAPFYLWLGVLTAQAHKEERFMFPIYPLLCFNAAVGVYLIKGWMEVGYIYYTKSPYRASQSAIFSNFSLFAIVFPGILSLGRILALHGFYHAPFDVAHHFEYHTVPSIMTNLGYEPVPLPKDYQPYNGEMPVPEWDFTPLTQLDQPVTLCYGTEWHRYPGSHLIPEGIDVRWIETDFDGMMPRKWDPSPESPGRQWPRSETRVVHPGRFNGDNQASSEPGTFVSVDQCDYLVALHLPSQGTSSTEPDFAADNEHWDKEFCKPFLDAASSAWWARLIWLPGNVFEADRTYGEYCLLHRKGSQY